MKFVPPDLLIPPGFVHVDLDGLWTLADCYGFAQGDSYERDPIYHRALPRLLEFLDRMELKATFFLVGRDLELPAKQEAAREIVRRGHEIANHTYHHPFGLEELSPERIGDEIRRAHRLIGEVTGQTPIGFRSPGYDAGPRVLGVLSDLGYTYDGSFLPTRWAPVLRWTARRLRRRIRRAREQAGERGGVPSTASVAAPEPIGQYGPGSGGAWGLAPQVYRATADSPPILRLPLAVSPFLRLPLHASMGMLIGRAAVISGLARLAARKWPVTYLLHGMDFADPQEFKGFLPPELAESRLFNIPIEGRDAFLSEVLGEFRRITRPERVSDYLQRCGATTLPNFPPVERIASVSPGVGVSSLDDQRSQL